MNNHVLPLEEKCIKDIYNSEHRFTYEVPIYQRNYAWEKDEISALIQDVYDSYKKNPIGKYFIGTLVSYNKGDNVHEVIDGQQRLTTINIILKSLNIPFQNKLTFKARKKSNVTIEKLRDYEKIDEYDENIVNGYKHTTQSIGEIISQEEIDAFTNFFLNNVHIIHYQVPKDIDLNHYFEIMNSRGEQLEKHEIIKARLINELCEGDSKKAQLERLKFNYVWENCSDMNVYIQEKCKNESIFGKDLNNFIIKNFDDINIDTENVDNARYSINELLTNSMIENLWNQNQHDKKSEDTFQPIINFPNFLLTVLKITRTLEENNFNPTEFTLDDKELIKEFENVKFNPHLVKTFTYNLLKARYFLDNFIVHHTNEDDSIETNPWILAKWQKPDKKGYMKNLAEGDEGTQQKLVQLLSMFEVSFTARQRKNYLFYCLLYLFQAEKEDVYSYSLFVENLARKYFWDIYMVQGCLNTINTPTPGSFDKEIMLNGSPNTNLSNTDDNFTAIYGDGTIESRGIPLFVFNYLDYKLWNKYAIQLKGARTNEESSERKAFFKSLGCNDFGLKVFERFYFSRTRRSLEHYYPQANATGKEMQLNKHQINCFGNYAMIGNEANSSGSNRSPKEKLNHYLDAGKIKQVSVASLKFMIMMQICKSNEKRKQGDEWNFEDIQKHQKCMLNILFS